STPCNLRTCAGDTPKCTNASVAAVNKASCPSLRNGQRIITRTAAAVESTEMRALRRAAACRREFLMRRQCSAPRVCASRKCLPLQDLADFSEVVLVNNMLH
ncbi:MAG: hypothetical protein ACKPKO_29090, partial [Candidatus Fonsibacter sp.]